MISILQTEFFRLKKSSLFWALFGVCAGLPLILALFQMALIGLVGSTVAGVDNVWDLIRSTDTTGGALSSLGSLMADFSLFALICTSIFLSKEFSGGTFRNMLLANRSRLEVYLSYLTISVVIGASYLGVSFVSTLLFFGSIFGFGTMNAAAAVTACIIALAMGLVSLILVQTMMCMFLFGTRKLSVALTCPLVICLLAPGLIFSFIEALASLRMITANDMSWIPLYNTNLLDVTNIDAALIGKILLYNIPLSVFFAFMGWVTFRKADLK